MKLTTRHFWFLAALVAFLAWVGALSALAVVSSSGPAATERQNAR